MRRSALTLALVGILALGGCGGEASPRPAPLTKTATTSPTVAPTMPSAAMGRTREAAIAFVSYYLDAVGYSTVTGDVAPLRPLGARNCRSCNGVIREILKSYAAGGRVTGSKLSVAEVAGAAGSSAGYTIRVKVKSLPETVLDNRTASPRVNPGGTSAAEFVLEFSGESYLISEWNRLR